MQMVPFSVEEELTGEAMVAMFHHGSLHVMGVRGREPDEQPVLIIGSEVPIQYSAPLNHKGEMETVHVQRFRLDCRVRGTGDPFTSVRPELDDPPDFWVTQSNGTNEVGLECTRLADGKRLSAQGLLAAVRQAVLHRQRIAFKNVDGCVVEVHALSGSGVGKLPKSTDPEVDALLEVIMDLDPSDASVPDGPLPEQAPDVVKITKSGRTGASVVRLPAEHRPTSFMLRSGFELDTAFTTKHTALSVLGDLKAIVSPAKKDVEANRILLITAGGVDHDGMIHPAEELVAQLLLDSLTGPLDPPRYLEKIFLHRWHDGDVWQLFPSFSRIVRPATEVPILGPAASDSEQITLDYPIVRADLLKQSRNQPCICGSGRKAKMCHLRVIPPNEGRT